MILTLDFETEAIDNRPKYPPKPVGVSLKIDDAKSKYFAFGHPTGNNCEEEFIAGVTRSLIEQADIIVMHNAAFDASVLAEKWNLPLDWSKLRCTMVQAFLADPYGELSLKPLADKLLDMPPVERDAVREWLIKNGVVAANNKKWGAFICYAPGDVVGPYAEGDTDRTYLLYQYFTHTMSLNLLNAFKREMDLMPIVWEMEKRGVNVDQQLLRADTRLYEQHLVDLDAGICKILGTQVCVDQDAALADAIEAAGLSKGFAATPTGRRSVAKESLLGAIADPQLLGMLLERNSVATCIRTFMLPWLEQAEQYGRLYVRWNQVRNYSDTGARTGRLSSSPNLQNIPTEWENLLAQFAQLKYTPTVAMPQIRKYIIPDEGYVFISADYAGQELRLLAHFSGGRLLSALQRDPKSDLHMIAANIAGITRKVAKTLAFAILYGAGSARIAEQLHITVEQATAVKRKYLAALPEIEKFQAIVQRRGATRSYVTTLGGREYYSESPRVIKGRFCTFDYKLVNYLIQGSAADQTKQAMLNYTLNRAPGKPTGQLVLTVHDQLVAQVPTVHVEKETVRLQHAMNSSFQDVLEYQVISDMSSGLNFSEV